MCSPSWKKESDNDDHRVCSSLSFLGAKILLSKLQLVSSFPKWLKRVIKKKADLTVINVPLSQLFWSVAAIKTNFLFIYLFIWPLKSLEIISFSLPFKWRLKRFNKSQILDFIAFHKTTVFSGKEICTRQPSLEEWRTDHGFRDLKEVVEALSERTETLSSDAEESLCCFSLKQDFRTDSICSEYQFKIVPSNFI